MSWNRNKPRVRVQRTRKPARGGRPAPGQVHDEDVLRWNYTVTEDEAVVLARAAGQGAPCLPAPEALPTLSPDKCTTAAEYFATLPNDAKNAMYRHIELASRHERLLLEGQERLKYVQQRVREMKQRMAAPPPAPPPHEGKGPVVHVVPIAKPSCWASCFGGGGQEALPPPPPELPFGRPPAAPLAVHIPPPEVFQEAVAARRRAATAGGGMAAVPYTSGGGASSAAVEPIAASSASVSADPCLPAAATPPPHGATAMASHALTPAELPGQLDAAAASEGGAPPPPGGARVLAPLHSKAHGMPQSLVRPLAAAPAQAAAATGAGAGAGGAHGSDGAMGQPGGGEQRFDVSRYQDPESLRTITHLQALQRGRAARKQMDSARAARERTPGSSASLAAASAAAPPPPPGGHPQHQQEVEVAHMYDADGNVESPSTQWLRSSTAAAADGAE